VDEESEEEEEPHHHRKKKGAKPERKRRAMDESKEILKVSLLKKSFPLVLGSIFLLN